MREILFRGKRVDNRMWIEGYYLKSPHQYSGMLKDYISVSKYDEEVEEGSEELYLIYLETVCQFTGLTDKNDVKIWEGDIVNIREHTSDVNGWYKVIYDTTNHCWALERDPEYHHHYFTFSELNGFAEDSEVIGNIFDNPELVEGGAE